MRVDILEVIPLILIIGGGVLYHVAQKSTPAAIDPFLTLWISFGVASLACLGLCVVRGQFSAAQMHRLNWTSIALALSVVLIESGYLVGYRAGLKLNVTSLVCNATVALVLVVVGTGLYHERLSARTGVGMLLCAGGLMLLGR